MVELTEDDFNFLVYSSSLERDANIDRVNQLKQQILQNQKLRELIEDDIRGYKKIADSGEYSIDMRENALDKQTFLQNLLEASK